MVRVLVGYATRSGSTHTVAEIIADELGQAGCDVDVMDLSELPQAAGYDVFVVGSGIHAGSWFIEAAEWLRAHASVLERTPVAVFNVCLNAADPAKRREALGYNRGVLDGTPAIASESFAGRYVPQKVNLWQRVFLRVMQQQPKDHIDPEAVRAWARTIISAIDSDS